MVYRGSEPDLQIQSRPPTHPFLSFPNFSIVSASLAQFILYNYIAVPSCWFHRKGSYNACFWELAENGQPYYQV